MSMQYFLNLIPNWQNSQKVETVNFLTLAGWSAILGVCVALLSVLVLSSLSKKKYLKGISLFWPFAIVWICGFVVYDVGMYTGEIGSLFGNIPMAILHAFGTFVLNSGTIHEKFRNNALFMFAFSTVHFAAAFISLWFVLKHFGFNIVAATKRFFEKSWLSKSKEATYVFWEMNDATYHLSKSINAHHKENGGSYRIIIVRSNDDNNVTNTLNGIERLFNFLSLNDKDIEKITEIEECFTTNTFVNLSELTGNSHDILKALGLKSVARLIERKTTGNVHVFFLSEDKSSNIQSVANLKKDCTLEKFMKCDAVVNGRICKDENGNNIKRQVKFYCHARHNSINRVIEDLDISSNIEVRIVDTSHLSIECLKREVSFQPISFVDIDQTKNCGTVCTPFNSLVVGFGETGKDALRFLYEFGAFVDSDSSNGTHRSKFNCHIVDKQLDSIKGPFLNASPLIFSNKNTSDHSLLVNLHSIDYNSNEFYNELLSELADSLNYVIIAIGNDEAGMTLAVRILKYLRRQGRDFKKLRIFVRSYESSLYPYMDKIARHYNEKEERIVLFGDDKQLYTYSMIVEDEFEQRGKEYYEAYRALNPQHDEEGSWEQRRKKLKGLIKLEKKQIDPNTNRPTFEETPIENPEQATLDNLQKLHRKEKQDKANALHEATKMKILETVMPNWYSQLVPCIFGIENTNVSIKREHLYKNNPKEIRYTELEPKKQLLMDNLAKLEHLRWNASHEVLGYTSMPDEIPNKSRGCDETRVTHNCLIDWELLDSESDRIDYVKDYKIYDYSVVETTIDIYRRKKEEKTIN